MLKYAVLALLLLMPPAARAGDAVPATAYFPVLPQGALPDTLPQFVPLAVNHAIDGDQADIANAVIVIHDETRDANAALAAVSALAGAANASTLILAPQFLLPSDIARFTDHLPDSGHAFAAWQAAGWVQGDDAVTSGRKGVSSYTVIDLLLMYLSDRKLFPNLRHITVAGFGVGGNFVQRFAALSTAPDIVARGGVDMRFLVAGASSYLYLTANRPLGGNKGWGRPDLTACPAYNDYPYGLDNLNAYARHTGGNAVKITYATRFVTYLAVPAMDANPDGNCAALAEGADRVTRAANFQTYLGSLYGDVAARTQTFAKPDAPNDLIGLFGSQCGMAVLFGDGRCARVFGDAR
ncbi:MAG: hypothetical protein P4M15_01600 [Alphaproteobacteria bacterium]|nr:hypothetical protein [Alphaproteobacteria bacterium]